MKKGLIFATTLAMALGVGVAVSAHQAKAAKVEAAGETTLYLDTNKLTWYGDQSRAYLYGTGGDNGWPGQALTQVEGSIYKLEVANMSNYQNVIFLRSNGTDVWNRTSKDNGTAISLPADWSVSNMWKFNDGWGGNEYDDGNYTGSWTKYTPAPTPEVEYNVTCVVDETPEDPIKVGEGELPAAKDNRYDATFDGWYTASDYKTKVTAITEDCSVYGRYVAKETAAYTLDDGIKSFSAYKLHIFNEDGNNGWPGDDLDGKSIKVPTDSSFILNDGNGTQTVDISQEGAKQYLRLLNETDDQGHYKVSWEAEPYVPDVPAEDGYYIVSTDTGFHYDGALKMTVPTEGDDKAQALQFTLGAGKAFKVRSYLSGSDVWYNSWGDPEHYTFDDKGNYINNSEESVELDIYLNKDSVVWVFAHEEPEPTHTYYYSLNGAAAVEMLPHEGTEVKSEELNFKKGDILTFKKDDAAYSVSPKEDTQLTKVYESGQSLVFAQEYSGAIYLETNGGYLWAGQFEPGYYLAGVNGEWNPKLAEPAHKVSELDPAYVVENVTVTAGAEVKYIEAPSNGNEFGWIKAVEDRTSSSTKVSYSIVHAEDESDGNLKLTNAGTYNFYYDPTGGEGLGWYSVENPSYQPEYTVKVGEAVYELELNEGSEYKIKGHDSVKLTIGEEVSFSIDGEEQEYARKHIGNNNLDENFEVMVTVDAQVYVDIVANTIFVGGLDFGGYHLVLNNQFVHMTHNEDPLDPSYREYYSGMIEFKKDDVVRFVDTTGDAEDGYAHVFDITNISESSAEGFEAVDGKLVAQKDVNLSVYLKLKSGADEVYFGPVAEEVALAEQFAKQFNTSIGGVCRADNKTDLEALGQAWQAQVTLFGQLAAKVQQVLKEPDETILSINEIAKFIEKYEYVAAKYGPENVLGNNYNFLERDLSQVHVMPYIGNDTLDTNNNT